MRTFLLISVLGLLGVTACMDHEERVSRLYRQFQPSVGHFVGDWGNIGTGVIALTGHRRAIILTNEHVCEAIRRTPGGAQFQNEMGQTYEYQIVKLDEKVDLCAADVSPALQGLALDPLAVEFHKYETLYELGYPGDQRQTPSMGRFLFEQDEMINGDAGPRVLREGTFTAPTFPGNSGSLVFNGWGEFVGLVNCTDPRTNNGCFISARFIIQFLRDL